MFPRIAAARAGGTLCALVLLLSACSGGSSASGDPAATPAPDLAAIAVSGEVGSKPKINLPTPFSVTKTDRRVLTVGGGVPISAGQRVTVNYVGLNGTDGKEFDSSFGPKGKSSSFILDPKQYLAGLVKGIIGTTVGSRVLVAIPPAEAYGVSGQPSVGIGPTDTIVIVVDVLGVRSTLKRAAGTPVAAKPGLPIVKLAANGQPTVTVPNKAAPAAFVVQDLILGHGPKVTKGQQITVNYTGVVWPGGRQFDSSWTTGAPASFQIGVGRVVAGWDEGLVGQPIGSQVLLVIPPDKGYGATGDAAAQIKGTDTLVFVVDILDAS